MRDSSVTTSATKRLQIGRSQKVQIKNKKKKRVNKKKKIQVCEKRVSFVRVCLMKSREKREEGLSTSRELISNPLLIYKHLLF